MCEEQKFDKEKFKQLLHYLIYKGQDKENVGKTVLYKLLYFSDFNFYEKTEKLITGESYMKWSHGPAPQDFDSCQKELKNEGKIKEISRLYNSKKQIKYISLQTPEISLIKDDELSCINETWDKLNNMGAREISEYSHGDMPWRVSKKDQKLDPEFVFYRNPKYNVREYFDE